MFRVCNLFTNKSLEEFLNQQHYKNILCDNMQVAFSSVKCALNLKPSFLKNEIDFSRFLTGRLTNIFVAIVDVLYVENKIKFQKQNYSSANATIKGVIHDK